MAINATFGSAEYRDNGVIAVPITFPENVVAKKFIINIQRVSGDDLSDIEYRLVGSDTDFTLIIENPTDRSGCLSLDLAGSVFKRTDSTYDQVSATAVKNVDYSTVVPRIDWEAPDTFTPGDKYDVRAAWNVPVTGFSNNRLSDVLEFEGAAVAMGAPTAYKWTGSSAPDFSVAVPDDLTGTDWVQLANAPAYDPNNPGEDFSEDGIWQGEELQYLLLRYQRVPEGTTGLYTVRDKFGTIRGPVS